MQSLTMQAVKGAFFFDKPVLEREETEWLLRLRIAYFVEQIIFVLLKRPSRSLNVQRIGNTRGNARRHFPCWNVQSISLVTLPFQRQWNNADDNNIWVLIYWKSLVLVSFRSQNKDLFIIRNLILHYFIFLSVSIQIQLFVN